MLIITNKENLTLALTHYAEGLDLNLNLLMECGDFVEKILQDEENDVFEKYEIYIACLLYIHLTLLQTDEFELMELLIKAFYAQAAEFQKDINAGEDEETINWKYFSDDFFQLLIQQQLQQYSIKK